jgi:hypothetical protein
MADKKKEKPHEEIIKKINSKYKAMQAYTWALKHEHETMLNTSRNHFIDKMGADKAYKHLKTNKGKKEFGDVGSKTLEEFALKKYGISKDKVHEFDLTRLVENTYEMNKDQLTEFIDKLGPEFDFADYKSNFLEEHINRVKSSILRNHVYDFDAEHIPAIIKSIESDEYFTDLKLLKNDKFKPSAVNAVVNYKEGKNKLGSDYYKKDPNFSLFLKDNYK